MHFSSYEKPNDHDCVFCDFPCRFPYELQLEMVGKRFQAVSALTLVLVLLNAQYLTAVTPESSPSTTAESTTSTTTATTTTSASTSSSVTQTVTSTPETTTPTSNLPLILGLSIGLGGAALIAVAIGIGFGIKKCREQRSTHGIYNPSKQETVGGIDHFQADAQLSAILKVPPEERLI